MPRRKKSSPAEELMGLIALLPWWAAAGFGIVGYMGLHVLATPLAISAVRPGETGGLVVRSLVVGLANAGQYVWPILCFGAAVMSAVKRKQRAALISNVVMAETSDALAGISWRQFEVLVGEAYRLQGFAVLENETAGPYGGVDLILRKGREKFFVQCKQWRAFKVGVQVVRELYGAMAADGAAGGYVVTSGRFTDDAVEFAKGRNVILVDGPQLFELIRNAQTSLGAQTATQGSARRETTQAQNSSHTPTASVVPSTVGLTCPTCSRDMTLRTAKRGANAGNRFWGSTGYPSCKGTRQA